MRFLIPSALLMTAALLSCDGKAPHGGIPLPPAYHRIATYSEEYTPLKSTPLVWEANKGCKVTAEQLHGQAMFIDLSYPDYKATLHITFTPVGNDSQLSEIRNNRTERMKLNAGDEESEVIEFDNPEGFSSTVIITPTGTPTPVQFFSSNHDWAVSGALLMSTVPQSADSISPVTDAVTRDIIHALKCLK